MASRRWWVLYLILGVVVLLGSGLYFWKNHRRVEEEKLKGAPHEKAARQVAQIEQTQKMHGSSMHSIAETQSALRTLEEINRMNRANEELQKDLQKQERRLGQ